MFRSPSPSAAPNQEAVTSPLGPHRALVVGLAGRQPPCTSPCGDTSLFCDLGHWLHLFLNDSAACRLAELPPGLTDVRSVDILRIDNSFNVRSVRLGSRRPAGPATEAQQ